MTHFAARLRALSKAASPGPWLTDEPANWHGISARVCTDKYEAICPVDLKGWGRRRGLANAELLVALRNRADRLADVVEAGRALVVRLDEMFAGPTTRAQVESLRAALDALDRPAP